jgi:hypothetical protein
VCEVSIPHDKDVKIVSDDASDMCKDKDCREENLYLIPRNMKGLSGMYRRGQVSTFDLTNAGGHGSTEYGT